MKHLIMRHRETETLSWLLCDPKSHEFGHTQQRSIIPLQWDIQGLAQSASECIIEMYEHMTKTQLTSAP